MPRPACERNSKTGQPPVRRFRPSPEDYAAADARIEATEVPPIVRVRPLSCAPYSGRHASAPEEWRESFEDDLGELADVAQGFLAVEGHPPTRRELAELLGWSHSLVAGRVVGAQRRGLLVPVTRPKRGRAHA